MKIKIFFEGAISKIDYLKEQFRKYIFLRKQYQKVFFKGAISKIIFLKKLFRKCSFYASNFENDFFQGAILKESNSQFQ